MPIQDTVEPVVRELEALMPDGEPVDDATMDAILAWFDADTSIWFGLFTFANADWIGQSDDAWPSREADMTRLSKAFPDVRFDLTLDTRDHLWREHYHHGKYVTMTEQEWPTLIMDDAAAPHHLIYGNVPNPTPDESHLRRLAAHETELRDLILAIRDSKGCGEDSCHCHISTSTTWACPAGRAGIIAKHLQWT